MIIIDAQLEAIHEGLKAVEEHAKWLDGNILKRLASGVKSKSKKGKVKSPRHTAHGRDVQGRSLLL